MNKKIHIKAISSLVFGLLVLLCWYASLPIIIPASLLVVNVGLAIWAFKSNENKVITTVGLLFASFPVAAGVVFYLMFG